MTSDRNVSYEFGPFRLDTAERLLFREGNAVPLTPRLFDILLVLVENRGHILEKETVLKAVWQETIVEEGNLTRNVSTLRKALGERPNDPQYIQTIPWRGYRFVADVHEVSNQTDVVVIEEHSSSRIIIEMEDARKPVAGLDPAIRGGLSYLVNAKQKKKWIALAAGGVLLLLLAGGLSILISNKSSVSSRISIKSLAVLPGLRGHTMNGRRFSRSSRLIRSLISCEQTNDSLLCCSARG